MLAKRIIIVLALCVVGCFALGALTEEAYAQSVKGDKSLASKESGTLGTKEFDQEKLPGKLEMGLAAGSIVVMIAAFKYL